MTAALTALAGTRMKGYVPALVYADAAQLDCQLQAEGSELDLLRAAITAAQDQFFPGRLTVGLDVWEGDVGAPTGQTALSDAQRNARVVARLTGYGTATIKLIKSVGSSFQNGAVDVIEDVGAYTISIRFVDTFGVPPDLGEMQRVLRALVPAHLAIVYAFHYAIWDQIDQANHGDRLGLRWDKVDHMHLTWGQWEVLDFAKRSNFRLALPMMGCGKGH